jgi:ADP-ribose pyrophosphatase
MLSIPIVEKSEILNYDFFKIQKDTLLLEDKSSYDYFSLLLKPAAVMVLAFDEEENLILINEWRHPTRQILLGCPGGVIEDNEIPLDAARRELLEETGYDCQNFSILGCSYPFPGITDQKTYFIKGIGAKKVKNPTLERAEILKPVILNITEVKKYINLGKPVCGLLCAGLWFNEVNKF